MNSKRWGFVVYWQDDQWTINKGPAVILARYATFFEDWFSCDTLNISQLDVKLRYWQEIKSFDKPGFYGIVSIHQ
jgi:hypothetical protein